MSEIPNAHFATVLLVAGAIGFVVATRGRLLHGAIAVGLVPVLALAYAMTVLMPLANEQASTRPLVRALIATQVPPEEIGCYVCPHLWVRDMPPSLERVRLLERDEVASMHPRVLVTRRKDADDLDLRGYRKVAELRMIGKWFDVYQK